MQQQLNEHLFAALDWLCRAQDQTSDQGVSAWYSLLTGWQPSYIETTGYIINSFFDCAEYYSCFELHDRAIAMADFLLGMQLPSGAYRVYTPVQNPSDKVVVFDMGQDLLGMTAAFVKTNNKKYLNSAIAAADFLISIQEKNGSWLKHTYGDTTHTYHTRVAWGILKVFELTGDSKYSESARANLDWAAQNQLSNGWLTNNHFPPPHQIEPFTHAISYAIEGFLWSGLLLKESKYIKIAVKAATPLLKYFLQHNHLPGTFNQNWSSDDTYTCLTGNAQLSLVWSELYRLTANPVYYHGATKMNRYLMAQQQIQLPWSATHGALAGSDPIWGDLIRNRGYCRLAYPNWAAKFFIDALLAEIKIFDSERKK